MRQYFTIAIFICLILLPFEVHAAQNSAAPSTTLQDRYQQAKYFYKHLETDKDSANNRQLWLKGSRKFRQVYLANPKSELAPASLFMLGRMYTRMYEKFQRRGDIQEAIGYYRDCASLFPHHTLADDSFHAIGNIYFELLKEHDTAAQYYTMVVTNYPHGDMHPQSATKLKILSSDYNLALPGVMLNGTKVEKLASVLPVKYWSSPDYSRVIVKASGPVTYSARLLEKRGSAPRRLYIDFHNSYIEPRYRSPVPISDGLLQRIRTGQNTQETVRVVLDIESISSYKIFSLPDPFRVVVDIRGVGRPETQEKGQSLDNSSSGKQPIVVLKGLKKRRPDSQQQPELAEGDDDQTGSAEISLAQQLGLGVRKIVIDPGHGGKDPGAIANGLKEKDVVLALAKKMRKHLEQNLGYEVLLTRQDDTYLSLEERTAIANGNNADLFISIHINAHPTSSVHGLETYFLNLTSSKEAMRVAAFENATSELQMSDLQDVLADIMKNSKIKESSRLAQNVHSTLISGLGDAGHHLKDLGVKQAPFYVLIGAEMPSILMEVAFISNPKEAKKLGDDNFLQSVAVKASQGIEAYINSNTARLHLQ
jgi:N-acetylmuramoyl-L-alanine amidase